MNCSKCGNTDAGCSKKKEGAMFFFVRMTSSFKEYSNLPCHVSKVFKTSKFLPARAPDEDQYMFKLENDGIITRIVGPEYQMFLDQYDMGHNNKIKFEFVNNDGYLTMTPFDTQGSIMEKVNWIYADEVVEHLDEEVRAVVISGGMKLKPQQMDNINTCIAKCGSGLGGIFVRRMTPTDILDNGLRIPKNIVSVLGVRRSGTATLIMNQIYHYPITDAAYYTTADSRIRFKTGWTEFVEAFNVEIGDTVLIMFHMIENVFQISFDYISSISRFLVEDFCVQNEYV